MSAHALDLLGVALLALSVGFVGGAYFIVRTRMGGAR